MRRARGAGGALLDRPARRAPGAKWDEALLQAIDSAGAFLLLLSAASNDSPFVQNEVNRAFGKKKAIFTFRIEDIPPSGSLEFYLARHHWTDGFPAPLEPKVAQLAAGVSGLLGVGELAGTTGTTAVAAGAPFVPPRPKKKAVVVPAWRRTATHVGAGVLAGGLLVGAASYATRGPALPGAGAPQVTRLLMPMAPVSRQSSPVSPPLAIAPNGRVGAFVGSDGGSQRLLFGT